MMDRVVGIGVVGMGWMGCVHGRSFRSIQDRFHDSGLGARLVICADEVEDRARQARERLGFDAYSTDWADVVGHPAVDAVIVTTPNHLHRAVAEAAARAGKHVFCEKPVGRNPRETARMAAAAARAGVLTGVGYNYRWAPLVQFARNLLAAGRLGEVTHYRGRFLVDYGSNPDGVLSWRFREETAGYGTLGDLMSHVIDMAHALAGPIGRVVSNRKTYIRTRPLATPGEGTHFSVKSEGPRGEVTNEDYVGALVQFSCGARGTLEACRVVKGPRCEMAFELNGTKGALRWNFERMNELALFLPDGTEAHDGPVLIQAGPQHPHFEAFYPGQGNSMGYEDLKLIEAYMFLKSVAEGKPGEPGFREALAVAQVQEAMVRSWASDRWESVQAIAVEP